MTEEGVAASVPNRRPLFGKHAFIIKDRIAAHQVLVDQSGIQLGKAILAIYAFWLDFVLLADVTDPFFINTK